MAIERSRFRGLFAPTEVVELKQICFTPTGVFQPGRYQAEELPDIAFNMGLVEKVLDINLEDKDKYSPDETA